MLFRKSRLKLYAIRDKGIAELYNSWGYEKLSAQVPDKDLIKNAPLYFTIPYWLCDEIIHFFIDNKKKILWGIFLAILMWIFGPEILSYYK